MIAFLLTAAQTNSNSSGLGSLILLPLLFAAMYFLLIRPQGKQKKQSQALQASLVEGDEVILTSGVYGFISAIEGDVVWVDIADGHGSERIEIRVVRKAIGQKVAPTAGASDVK